MVEFKKVTTTLLALCAFSLNAHLVSQAKMSNEALKYFQSAQNNESEKRYFDAINDLSKAIELDSHEAILYTKQGGLFVEIGDWQNALAAF